MYPTKTETEGAISSLQTIISINEEIENDVCRLHSFVNFVLLLGIIRYRNSSNHMQIHILNWKECSVKDYLDQAKCISWFEWMKEGRKKERKKDILVWFK